MNEITIITVSYNHDEIIRSNLRFIDHYSGCKDPSMIIVNNSTRDLSIDASYHNKVVISNTIGTFTGPCTASYHHASAINLALRFPINTRFLLVLDPDFFIIGDQWIHQVTSYMQERNLSFFGAPWNPIEFIKYRYFPSVHCMFIDLKKVPQNTLDFTPEIDKMPFTAKLNAVFKYFPIMNNRFLVGTSRDTGYKVYHRYFKSKMHQCECLGEYVKSYDNKSDSIFPEYLSLYPKKSSYIMTKSFLSDYGIINNYEEFFWNNKPWAFHLRLFGNQNKNAHEVIGKLERLFLKGK